MNSKNADIPILVKFLAGEATPEEAMDLDDWINIPANKKEFQQLNNLWNKLSDSGLQQKPLAEAWIEIAKDLYPQKKRNIGRGLINRYSIAAVLVGIVLTVTWVKSYMHPGEVNVITKNAYGAVINDTLSDGSIIIMNHNSTITYSNQFNKGKNREIFLRGEAFFRVTPDKIHPFIIHTGKLHIRVVGTSFNVKSNNENHTIEVQVQSGIVKIYTNDKQVIARMGETGIYSLESKEITLEEAVNLNSLSYATKSFYFKNEPLSNVYRYLEMAFNVTLQFDKIKFSECRLTAHFEEMDINYILKVLDATLNTTSKVEVNTINISGNGCH